MTLSALKHPTTDPTPIFEHFRGNCALELLTAAIAHFDIFGRLNKQPLTFAQLRDQLGLQTRPAMVLITALRAMGFICKQGDSLSLTELAAEHLVPGANLIAAITLAWLRSHPACWEWSSY